MKRFKTTVTRTKEYIIEIDKNTRTSEILINDQWKFISPIEIKEGMIFRMFEPDGEPFVGLGDTYSWVATSDAYCMEDGVICVKTDK